MAQSKNIQNNNMWIFVGFISQEECAKASEAAAMRDAMLNCTGPDRNGSANGSEHQVPDKDE
jgi:hypothetical protein